jgi:hypothetical protein
MTGTHKLFTGLSEIDSNLHVELGTNAKCGVEGVGRFSGGGRRVVFALSFINGG